MGLLFSAVRSAASQSLRPCASIPLSVHIHVTYARHPPTVFLTHWHSH